MFDLYASPPPVRVLMRLNLRSSESPTKHTVLADLAHNRAGITPVSTEDGYLVLYGGAYAPIIDHNLARPI